MSIDILYSMKNVYKILGFVSVLLLLPFLVGDSHAVIYENTETKRDYIKDNTYTDKIHIDSSIGFSTRDGLKIGGPVDNIEGNKYVAVDLQTYKNIVDITEQTSGFVTIGDIALDDSVNPYKSFILTNQYDTTWVNDDTVVLTLDRYNEIQQILMDNARDENAAPSLSGFNTRDADRISFGNVLEQPVFVMSNTEIHVLSGKAISPWVPVYFDGVLIDIIFTSHGKHENTPWTGFGGEIIDIPFEAYYYVTEEGQLIHHGKGYQHIFRDFSVNETQVDLD